MPSDVDKQRSDSLVQIAPANNAVQQWMRNRYGTFRGLIRLLLANAESLLGRLHRFKPDRNALSRYERLVFVCQGNICRSAYAEFRAKERGLPSVSIGLSTMTGQPAFRLTQEAAARRGLDMSAHQATDLADFQVQPGDLLLVMETRQASKLEGMTLPDGAGIALLGHWTDPLRIHIHDPFELEPAYFDTCFTVIDGALNKLSDDWWRVHVQEEIPSPSGRASG